MELKTFSNITTKSLIVFLFIAVLCSGCSSQPGTRGTVTLNSSDETPGFLDYNIETIGIKFKYPDNWAIHPNINSTNQLALVTSKKIDTIQPVALALITPPCGNCDTVVFMGAEVLPLNLTNEQYYKERKANLKTYWNASADEIPVINYRNIQFYGLSYDYLRKGNATPRHAREYIYIKNGTAIRIVYDAKIDTYSTYESAFETILSSFS